MLVGLPKEIKNHEYRVGLTPASVHELSTRGHQVLVQRGAGADIGLSDAQHEAPGASLAVDAASEFAQADMIVKVKEPQPQECALLRPDQILYTYLHLAPDPAQTAALIQSGAVCIAHETITGPGGGRHARAANGGRSGRAGHGARQKRGAAAPARPGVWQPHQHRLRQRPQCRRGRAGRRPGDWRRGGGGRSGTQADDARHGCPHQTRRRGG